jgi:hypothetical protein
MNLNFISNNTIHILKYSMKRVVRYKLFSLTNQTQAFNTSNIFRVFSKAPRLQSSKATQTRTPSIHDIWGSNIYYPLGMAKHLSTLSSLFPHQLGILTIFPAPIPRNRISRLRLNPASNAAARI